MSEKEKTSLDTIVDKVNQLGEADSKYVLGIIDGMAMANANADAEKPKEAG